MSAEEVSDAEEVAEEVAEEEVAEEEVAEEAIENTTDSDDFESQLAGITYNASEEQATKENGESSTNDLNSECPMCGASVEQGASKCSVCGFTF